MKTRVVLDFETWSDVDVKRHGRMRYAQDPSTDILMAGYRYVSPHSSSQMWFPGDPLPDFLVRPEKYDIVAHNAEFEWAITNFVGVRRYNFSPTTIQNYTCTMALSARYGLPQSLEAVGEVLHLDVQKNPEGKALIQLFCTPGKNFGLDPDGFIAEENKEKWSRFVQYCHDDVNTEYALLHALPASRLSEEEKATWVQSCQVNARGIPVDVPAIRQIRKVTEEYREKRFQELPALTGGSVTKITQTQRILKFVNARLATPMPDCQGDTVAKMLEQELPRDVAEVLEMRASIGLSSVGKYKRFEDMEYQGRIYDNQRYYGAATGRWTGCGVQLLNLPRASIKSPNADALFKQGHISAAEHKRLQEEAVDREIQAYFTGSITHDNPVQSARALIRSMVKAPEGKRIAAADYSAIEYIVLEWIAGDKAKVQKFADGADQYTDQAAAMYQIQEKDVSKAQRQAGKVVILGCGYGQGAKRLVSTAEKQWGMKLSPEDADFMVRGYRKNHAAVVHTWYDFKDAALFALQSPREPFRTHGVTFTLVQDHTGCPWLAVKLPSRRTLYYNRPFVKEDKFGLTPCHWGYSQTTKSWVPMRLIPGRITENVVQATARDILVNGMRRIEQEMGPIIIWSIYDEVVCEIEDRDHEEQLDQICRCMCSRPSWGLDIPLRADGFVGPRYKKM